MKKKLTFWKKKIQQQKNKQKQTKNWSRGPLGPPYLHVVYIQPPSPGGKLKEFVGGDDRGCAAETLEPLAYTRPRFSLILICYPILE